MSNPLNGQQVHAIRTSFEAVKPRATELIDTFYATLFREAPQVRPMFPDDMTAQKKHLLGAVSLVATKADDLASVESALLDMGERHVGYGAQPEHYPVVRDVMLSALRTIAGELWTPEFEDAWTTALNTVAGVMLEGAARVDKKKAA